MKTIDKAAIIYSENNYNAKPLGSFEYYGDINKAFIAGAEFAQQWISVEQNFPPYAEEVFVKFVNGTHSNAYYLRHKHRKDSFYNYLESDIEFILEAVTHWRPIEIK